MNPSSLDLKEKRNKLIKDTLIEILEDPGCHEFIAWIVNKDEKSMKKISYEINPIPDIANNN